MTKVYKTRVTVFNTESKELEADLRFDDPVEAKYIFEILLKRYDNKPINVGILHRK